MNTRKKILEQLIKSEDHYFFMYSEAGVMYFRNEKQISEEEYMKADRATTAKKEMPLFFDSEVKKKYNLKTFEDVNR